MADSKITALTALTAADPINDMFPVVDVSDTSMAASGTTKKISVNNILSSSPTASGALTVTGLVTAGSATITGAATVGTTLGVTGAATVGTTLLVGTNATLTNGNVIIGTSGKGIDFTATSEGSGTMTSELLNDYEEGTWTGTIGGTTSNPTTPVTSTGRYTKIGRQVFIEIGFYGDTTGASSRITVSGLPFTSNASLSRPGVIAMDTMGTFTGSPIAFLAAGVTSVDLYASNSNGSLSNVTHNAGAGRALYMALTYSV